jgi:hypothetical protein
MWVVNIIIILSTRMTTVCGDNSLMIRLNKQIVSGKNACDSSDNSLGNTTAHRYNYSVMAITATIAVS